MADDLGIMLTELPEAESISDNDLFYLVKENNSDKVKAKTIKDSLLGDFYGEASGNPASFADGAAAGLVECIADIEATQDLHGYSKPWAGGAGKNILDISNPTYPNTVIDSSGDIVANSFYNTWEFIGGKTYTLNMVTGSGFDGVRYALRLNGVNTRYFTTDLPLTIDATNYDMLYICLIKSNLGTNVQLEVGETATDYEPYANICPISGHSSITINVSPTSDPSQGVDTTIQLGDTYYRGTLNAVKGELVVTHEGVDLGTLSWTSISNNRWHTGNQSYIKPVADNMDKADAICDSFDIAPTATIYSNVSLIAIGITTTSDIICRNGSTITPPTGYLVYELATPQTVQLTPTAINSLLGQNYISSDDTEDIDLVYTKATAFIKPNPSGEADGYLSSIELSGEKFEIIKELPTFPTSDGDYKLKLSVSSGVPTLSWVSDT